MCKIDQIHSGTACAAPADMMEQAIEQAAASGERHQRLKGAF